MGTCRRRNRTWRYYTLALTLSSMINTSHAFFSINPFSTIASSSSSSSSSSLPSSPFKLILESHTFRKNDGMPSHQAVGHAKRNYYSKRSHAFEEEGENGTTKNPNNTNNKIASVLCVGETLWDVLPHGRFLGGAPTNVAVHLSSLLVLNSNDDDDDDDDKRWSVGIASCLGKDELAHETIRILQDYGVRTDYIQRPCCIAKNGATTTTSDDDLPRTGIVTATLDERGDATYVFDTPSAWDCLQYNSKLKQAVCGNRRDECRVILMGTLAGRLAVAEDVNNSHACITSASTLQAIRLEAGEDRIVLDVNLRSPWYTKEFVLNLARGGVDTDSDSDSDSDSKTFPSLALIKVNEEELKIMEDWCGLMYYKQLHEDDSTTNSESLTGNILRKRMEAIALATNANRVCVTRGEHGAALLCTSTNEKMTTFHEHDGFATTAAIQEEEEEDNESDTVGAGDAFLAAIIHSLFLMEESPDVALTRGCALGAYVANRRGATPQHQDAPSHLKDIFASA